MTPIETVAELWKEFRAVKGYVRKIEFERDYYKAALQKIFSESEDAGTVLTAHDALDFNLKFPQKHDN